jgi:hypothetical protein
MRNYGNRELISEVRRIQSMMGVNNTKIISEALVGGGLIDEILSVFLKKGTDDFAQLGFKSADEMTSFADELAEAATEDAKILLLKKVIPNMASDVLRGVADEILEGSSTIATRFADDVDAAVKEFGDFVKAGNADVNTISKMISDNLSKGMSLTDEGLSKLKNALEDAMTEKATKSFDVPSVSKVSDDVAQQAAKEDIINKMMQSADANMETVFKQLETLPSYKSMPEAFKKDLRAYVESNKTKMSLPDLKVTAETQLNKIINDPNYAKATRTAAQKAKDFITGWWGKSALSLLAVSAVVANHFGVLDNIIGSATDTTKTILTSTGLMTAETPSNSAVVTPGVCNQTLETFKTFLKTQTPPPSDVALNSATFNPSDCSGNILGLIYVYNTQTGVWE